MRILPAALALGLAASAASADAIFSFGFTDLSSSFNSGSSTYTAVGVNTATLHTAGNVNRLIAPTGTAAYDPGAAAGLINLNLTVSGITPTSANGSGSITILDADGDSFQAQVSGSFSLMGGAVFFNGSLTNPMLVPDGTTNNAFNGPSGGSIPLTFAPAPGPYSGAVVQLFFNPGTFFANNFADVATQVTGSVIPTPSTLALIGLGGLAATRRRRR